MNQLPAEEVQDYLNRLTDSANDLANAYSQKELVIMSQRGLATDLRPLIRKYCRKLTCSNALKDSVDCAKVLAEPLKTL